MKITDDRFKFFVPLNLSKGEDDKGNAVMKIGGIASTPEEDADGEFLDPEGFDLDYFLKYGFLNWHHQSKTSPSAIVGEPTSAYVKDRKLYVEGDLYNDSTLAKDIYALAKALESNKSNRRLGFSIEGSVTERDPMNAKYVKKAKITGCAITPTPKNSSTLAQIIKGGIDDMSDIEYEYDEVEHNANGGDEAYILDIIKPTGERITVDKNFHITIKSMNTSNAAPLIPEDVDGSAKDLQKVGQKKRKGLTKGEVYGQIFHYLHDADNEIAKSIFTLIDKIQKSQTNNPMEKTVSQETIDKAFITLGIVKSTDDVQTEPTLVDEDALVKGKVAKGEEDQPDDYEEAGEEKDEETKEDVEKGDSIGRISMSKSEYEATVKSYDEMSDKLEKMKKAISSYEDAEKAMGTEGDTMGASAATEGGTENPSNNESTTHKGESDEIGDDGVASDEIAKALEDQSPLGELIKAEMKMFGEKVDALGTVQKAMSDNFENLEERISQVEEQSLGRKSVTTQGYLQKSFDREEGDGVTTLSVSTNKVEILDLLDRKADITEKGIGNASFADAMAKFESSGYLDKNIAQRLFIDDKVRIAQ